MRRMKYKIAITIILTICVWVLPILIEMYAFLASMAITPWLFIVLSIPMILFSFLVTAQGGISVDIRFPRCGFVVFSQAVDGAAIASIIWIGARLVNTVLFVITEKNIVLPITWAIVNTICIVIFCIHVWCPLGVRGR